MSTMPWKTLLAKMGYVQYCNILYKSYFNPQFNAGMDLHMKSQHNQEIIANEMCKICGVKIPIRKMRLHLENVHLVIHTE